MAWGQYAPSASGSATAAAEINSKPAIQSGAAVASGNCTAGKDFWLNTLTGAIQACTATNTWGAATLVNGGVASVSSLTITGTTSGTISLAAGTGNLNALPANSAGWTAPATGGTSYLIKPPNAIVTAGVAHLAAAATEDNVLKSAMTVGLVTSADVDSTVAVRNAANTFSGIQTIPSINLGLQSIATGGGTTTLTAATPYYTVFTGSQTQTVVLPDATTLSVGQKYGIENDSTQVITVNTSGGGALWIIAPGADLYLALLTNSPAAGTWEVDYSGVGTASGKKLTVSNTLTLAGTDGTTMTFPSTSATIARTDAANTFTGVQTMTSPAMTTPVITTDAHCASAGGCTIGTAALPISDIYLGGSATNNLRLTGTGTTAKTITFPDFAGWAVIAATSTTATQALMATATAGAPAYRAIVIGDLAGPLGTPVAGGIAYGSSTTRVSTTAIGTAKQVVLSGGSGAPTMIDFPEVQVLNAAVCVNATATSLWNLPASGTFTPTCRAGTQNLGGTLNGIPSTGAVAYMETELPGDWDTATKPWISIYYGSGANTSGTAIWTVSTGCTKKDGTVSDDVAWIAESAMGTQTMGAATRAWAQSAQLAGAMTNCVVGSTMYVKVAVSGTASSAITVSKAVMTYPRLLVAQAN